MQATFECENNISFEIGSLKGRYWYYNNQYHRENGPATIYSDDSRYWYKHGKIHRLDGPAFEYSSGYKSYWIEGNRYSESQFLEVTNASHI